MCINVKSILACLLLLLLFTAAFFMAIRYLVSFYKLFTIILLTIGLSHGFAQILLKKDEAHYE